MVRGASGRKWRLAPVILAMAALVVAAVSGQSGATDGEWHSYGGDTGNTRYSPLDQINADNFNTLEVAWRFKTDNLGPQPEYRYQSTPLVVDGTMYVTGGSRRSVVALDAASGELLWVHRLDEGERAAAAPRRLSGRGLAYWSDGFEERILYVTPGYRLVALDAATGQVIPGFGDNGMVDLKLDNDQPVDDLVTAEFGLHAAPTVAGNTVIVGASHQPGGSPRFREHEKGNIRGYDVRTGERMWIFHTIPRPGEVGNETWLEDSWAYTGNAGVWGQISVDEELEIAYLPVELPTGDVYGGNRPGNGLFGESLVAVDLNTGELKWYYQLIHHGVWDYDIPSAPILADVMVDGRLRQIVAQPTKQAFLYVFDRVTGEPIWPIEERPVPQGNVPGEWYSPTQPFPTKPPPYDLHGITIDDLIDFTPELRAQAQAIVSRYQLGPIYTPPVLSTWEGPLGTLVVPSIGGGSNWEGGSFDPDTGYVYLFSSTSPSAVGLLPVDPAESDFGYRMGTAPPPGGGRGGGRGGLNVQGLPLLKPPYARITAIDLKTGDIAWQIPHGETADEIRTHPALQGMDLPRLGRPGRIGTLVTKTLLIAGEGGFFTTPSGERGAMLRAYDKATGRDVGEVYMPAPQSGSPMTYMIDGEQYIALAISGGNYSGELLAFKLPN
jgi:quinoprotein glucose dehydrogenase